LPVGYVAIEKLERHVRKTSYL